MKTIEQLKNKRSKVLARYENECIKNALKFQNLGWGCAMRGYSRLAKFSTKREDELKRQLEELDKEIEERINNEIF